VTKRTDDVAAAVLRREIRRLAVRLIDVDVAGYQGMIDDLAALARAAQIVAPNEEVES
jgi:hypothetical protein